MLNAWKSILSTKTHRFKVPHAPQPQVMALYEVWDSSNQRFEFIEAHSERHAWLKYCQRHDGRQERNKCEIVKVT